jgi:hypothetical protein
MVVVGHLSLLSLSLCPLSRRRGISVVRSVGRSVALAR